MHTAVATDTATDTATATDTDTTTATVTTTATHLFTDGAIQLPNHSATEQFSKPATELVNDYNEGANGHATREQAGAVRVH